MKHILFKSCGNIKFSNGLYTLHPAILLPNVVITYTFGNDIHYLRKNNLHHITYNGAAVKPSQIAWCGVITHNLKMFGYTEHIYYP